jgi:uncharacterized protein (DUF302 family)
MSENGLVTVESAHAVPETIDRLAATVTAAGLTVFARIDHAAGATEAGMPLRPTELLIFGHPRGGTPLMQDRQTAGIDLPVKALAWEDETGKVWLTYTTGAWIALRHDLGPDSHAAVAAIDTGLEKVTGRAATTGPVG